jgi:glycosyltransferase involved in cell wall biosynthesis
MITSEQTPSISVVMPLYNKEHEVLRAIHSVLLQTVTDFEIIVINDGSTDKGPDIVRSINDPRVSIIDQPNAGVSAARNRGISEAGSNLIAFLDADDEWSPDFLETIMTLKRGFPDCSAFATSYFIVNKDGFKRSAVIRGLPKGFQKGILKQYFVIAANSDPPLWTSAIAVTRSAIESIGGFPIGVVAGEDLLTWARLAAKYDIAYTIESKAYFWQSVQSSDHPRRIPDDPDIVGRELEILLRTCLGPRSKSLNDYVALWYRMRASIYIRLGRRWSALKEIRRAASFSGVNLKLFAYFFLALLPKSLFTKLLELRRYSFP